MSDICCLCGGENEWWGGNPNTGGRGHNPEPLASYPQRCCDMCNATKVLPARIARLRGGAG
jgi:hypothetical protein